MTDYQLSKGFFERALKEEVKSSADEKPIVQIMTMKTLGKAIQACASDSAITYKWVVINDTADARIKEGSVVKFLAWSMKKLATKSGSHRLTFQAVQIEWIDNPSGQLFSYAPLSEADINTRQIIPFADPNAKNSETPVEKRPPAADISNTIEKRPRLEEKAVTSTKACLPAQKIASDYDYTPQMTQSGVAIFPITCLTPFQNRWKIRVRVTSKSVLKHYNNARGAGKLFSMDLSDESGEMRATAFNEQADKFYDMIETGQIYYISNAQIKSANKQFTSIRNDYEMMLSNRTEIEVCQEETKIPKMSYNFVKFDKLADFLPKEGNRSTPFDALGIVQSVGDVVSLVSKDGRPLKKRDINIIDDTNNEVVLTFWNEQAETLKIPLDADAEPMKHPVLALKAVIVREFQGYTLSTSSSTHIEFNPDIPEAAQLAEWWFDKGHNVEHIALSGIKQSGPASIPKAIAVCQEYNFGFQNTDFFSIVGDIVMVKTDNCLYKACPNKIDDTRNCNKKLNDMGNGRYRCEKCDREYENEFEWRAMLRLAIGDYSGVEWITCFNEQVEMIMNTKVAEIGAIMDEGREEDVNDLFNELLHKRFIFRVRAKAETYNDDRRIKWNCVSGKPYDPEKMIEHYMKSIDELKVL